MNISMYVDISIRTNISMTISILKKTSISITLHVRNSIGGSNSLSLCLSLRTNTYYCYCC